MSNKYDGCECFVEYHASPREGTVKGCLLANIDNYSEPKIKLNCSSSILVKTVTVNGQNAFFSRFSMPNDKGNLTIFIPSKSSGNSPFWSPIPTLVPTKCCKRACKIVIFFEIKKRNPALLLYPNFICFTNIPYGVSGWLPLFCDFPSESLKKIVIRADREGYVFFGPNLPIKSTPISREYNTSNVKSVDIISWGVGDLISSQISGFTLFSIGKIKKSTFSFLENIRKKTRNKTNTVANTVTEEETSTEKVSETENAADVSEVETTPFLVLPTHFCELEITYGFSILSSILFLDFCNLPFPVPIPSAYQLISAVSFAIAYDLFARRFKSDANFNWFVHGLISYASRLFMKASIGEQGMEFFDWSLLQYLWKYDDGKLDLTSESAREKLNINNWELRCPFRVKSQYVVNVIASMFMDDLAKPRNFPQNWPDRIDMTSFCAEISKFSDDPDAFLKMWTRNQKIPVAEVELNHTIDRKLRTLSNENMIFRFINVKENKTVIPGTFHVFHHLGIISQTVLMNLTDNPVKTSFVLPKNRSRRITPDKMRSLDGLYWIAFETKPQLPIIIFYIYPPQTLMTIITEYHSSIRTQHEALSSLARILLHQGDNGTMEILNFLGGLLIDNKSFYTLKCHSLKILSEISQKYESNASEASKARELIITFFLDEIVNKNTTMLQKQERVNSACILTTFQAISKLVDITDKFNSFDFLKSAMNQLAGQLISPGIVLCFLQLHFTRSQDISIIVPQIISFMSNGADNPPLMTAAVRVFGRLLTSYDKSITDKIMISFVSSFEDHFLHIETRLAIAEVLLVNYPSEAYFSILKGLKKELDFENPSFKFIERAMKLIRISCADFGEEQLKVFILNSNISEISNILRTIAFHSRDAATVLYRETTAVFEKLLSAKWNKNSIPEGLIKNAQLDLSDEKTFLGMFSDSE